VLGAKVHSIAREIDDLDWSRELVAVWDTFLLFFGLLLAWGALYDWLKFRRNQCFVGDLQGLLFRFIFDFLGVLLLFGLLLLILRLLLCVVIDGLRQFV
jgi:hypothetical protein